LKLKVLLGQTVSPAGIRVAPTSY